MVIHYITCERINSKWLGGNERGAYTIDVVVFDDLELGLVQPLLRKLQHLTAVRIKMPTYLLL